MEASGTYYTKAPHAALAFASPAELDWIEEEEAFGKNVGLHPRPLPKPGKYLLSSRRTR